MAVSNKLAPIIRMKNTYRYLILFAYAILNLTLFWNAQFFLKCNGFLCSLFPTLLVWTVFILTTFVTYLVRPLTFKKSLIRFIITVIVVIFIYCAYYNSIDYSYWSNRRWFFDYSLPGIFLTIGFSLTWLLPIKKIFKNIRLN